MTIRKCTFKGDWLVMISDNGSPLYEMQKPLFEKFGLAYADLENRFIIINGEEVKNQNLTIHHIHAIEAHEIGHFVSDHIGLINKSLEKVEQEADWAGYQILLKYKKVKAAKILAERFKESYQIDINDYAVSGTERYKIQNFLNEIKDI